MKVILASHNQGKIREFKACTKHLSIDLIPQAEFHINDIEEIHTTFVENALLKARHASLITGLPAIADDSGLSVAALSSRPGIYSARYAGKNAADAENIDKILSELKDVPLEKREASFHCVIVYLAHADDPMPLICEGHWKGVILHQKRGKCGFGYDSIFYVPSKKKSAAELSITLKNKISHRGLALQSLIQQLPEKLAT